jgi:hypothetical protein
MTGRGIFQCIMRFIHYNICDTCDIITSDKCDMPRKNDLMLSASSFAPVPGSDKFAIAEGALPGH